jgi:hypothetical protein
MSTFIGLLAWIAILAAYWSPSVLGALRHVPNLGSVIVVNFFGFTFVCWIVALALACRSVPHPEERAGMPAHLR